jgi:hypothetical protein
MSNEPSNTNQPKNDLTGNHNSNTGNQSSAPFLSDLTDGRKAGDWKSRYSDPTAINAIKFEKKYLISIIAFDIILYFVFGIAFKYSVLSSYCLSSRNFIFAFLGGAMGGCIFSAKWLVHSVAKNTWNIDRKLWRVFTPIVSGVLGFLIILLLSNSVISLGKVDSGNPHKCYGIAFLVGYFSDNAIGKLTEIAQVFFGSSSRK